MVFMTFHGCDSAKRLDHTLLGALFPSGPYQGGVGTHTQSRRCLSIRHTYSNAAIASRTCTQMHDSHAICTYIGTAYIPIP